MRWLVRKIWRAYPELDRYSDETCRAFMRKVQGPVWFRALGAVFSVACVVVSTYWLTDRVLVPWTWRRLQGPEYSWWIFARDLALGAAAIAFTAGACALLVLRLRDWAIHIGLRRVLRGSGRCVGCSYSLVGLPVPDSFEVACPECGRVCRVHHSLKVLILDSIEGDAESHGSGSQVPTPKSRERLIGSDGLVVEPPSLLWSAFFSRTGVRVWASVLGVLVLVVAGFFGTIEGLAFYYGTVVAPIAANPAAEWKGVQDARAADPDWADAVRRNHAWVEVESQLWEQLASKPELRLEQRYLSWAYWLNTRGAVGAEPQDEVEQRTAADVDRLLEAIVEIDAVRLIRSALTPAGAESDSADVGDFDADSPAVGEAQQLGIGSGVPFQKSGFWRGAIGAIGQRAVHRRDFAAAAACVECLCAMADSQIGLVGPQAGFDRWTTLKIASGLLEAAIKAEPDNAGLLALERAWRFRPRTEPVIKAACEAGMAETKLRIAGTYSNPRMARLVAFEVLGVPEWLRYLTPAPGAFVPAGANSPVAQLAELESFRTAVRSVLQSKDLHNQGSPPPAIAGNRFLGLTWGSLGVFVLVAREEREDLFARTLLAIGRWRLERGIYPQSVMELVPSHLSEIPRMPSTGTRLELRPVVPSGDPSSTPFMLVGVPDDTVPSPALPDE
jgi:hypothetical protein